MFLTYHTLIAEKIAPHITMIAFNRPEAANALNMQMALELGDAFSTIINEPGHSRVVILTGQGKHFCAGADLKERQGMDEEAWFKQHESFERALQQLIACPVPVIAAVNGAAMGGGLELALACDFIYASPNARFGLTETSLGIMPGLGGTYQLARRVGLARAKELIYCGKPFSAEEALNWGVVNQLYPMDGLLAAAKDCAQHIAQQAPLAIAAVKQAAEETSALGLKTALEHELSYYNSLLGSNDRHEGINAFNEKRKPVFAGQ
ncbi:MAG: enoyl-CoA hydratase-related protein [Rickettsiales bacterium]|nr:enoyl-CoA hydratase-related protein [Rickettsiales bacterium]